MDRHGISLSIGIHPAQKHEARRLQLNRDQCSSTASQSPRRRQAVQQRSAGRGPSGPRHGDGRTSRRNWTHLKTQDGRRPRKYKRPWVAGCVFVWVQCNQRILIRWECDTECSSGCVPLAALCLLLRPPYYGDGTKSFLSAFRRQFTTHHARPSTCRLLSLLDRFRSESTRIGNELLAPHGKEGAIGPFRRRLRTPPLHNPNLRTRQPCTLSAFRS